MELLRSALTSLLDRSPAELIGAVLIATASSLLASGFYQLLKRGAVDPPMLMAAVMVPTTCIAMALVAGQLTPGPRSPAAEGATTQLSTEAIARILDAADVDRDCRVSTEEATRFLRSVRYEARIPTNQGDAFANSDGKRAGSALDSPR